MKKMFLFCGIFLALFLFNASAISVSIKSDYAPQETMTIKISGDIREPITNNNIVLKRNNVIVPLDYDVKKLGNDYYLWALAPLNENNYTLWINDVTTTITGTLNKTNFAYNFTVSGNLTDYYLKQSVIYANEDFEISAYNNRDIPLDIGVDFPEAGSFTLLPGENKISFSISGIDGTQLSNFSIGKYEVYAYIIGREVVNNTSTDASKILLYFIPQKIKREVFANERITYPIVIVNDGNESVKTSLEYNKNIFTIDNEPEVLDAGEKFSFNLSIKTNSSVSENLILHAGESNYYLKVEIMISNLSSTGQNASGGLFYCDELAGKICKSGETCSAETVSSLNGACCRGNCAAESGESRSWIGYLIAAFVVIGAIFIYYRYKKVKPEASPLAKRALNFERKL